MLARTKTGPVTASQYANWPARPRSSERTMSTNTSHWQPAYSELPAKAQEMFARITESPGGGCRGGLIVHGVFAPVVSRVVVRVPFQFHAIEDGAEEPRTSVLELFDCRLRGLPAGHLRTH